MSLLDQMFAAVANIVTIPCTASGSANAIVINPNTNAPTLPAYANYNQFTFKAIASSTAATTVQFIALTALPLYLADGVTQVTNQIVSGRDYIIMFDQALNASAGGFILLGPIGQQAAIEFIADNAGVPLTASNWGYLEVPFACTVQRFTALADVSGSVIMHVGRSTYSAFAAGTLTEISDAPAIAAAVKMQETNLAGWTTTTINAGDILGFSTGAATNITRLTMSLQVTRS
jgi:hypothetical protein